MYTDITGVILSGGKSTRMGKDKSVLRIGEETIIAHLCRMMAGLFTRVVVIGEASVETLVDGVEVYPDLYPGNGPLGGIHTGMVHAAAEKIFLLPCDAPLLTPEIIKKIIGHPSGKPIIIPRGAGFIQHLIGLFSVSLLPDIEQVIDRGNIGTAGRNQEKCSIGRFINGHAHEIVEFPVVDYPNEFLNLNSPADYEILLRLIQ
jgi:molybdopterin-guanine dinucleotide biosynthesis protein A